MTFLPVGMEPVNTILLMPGCSAMWLPTSGPPVTALMTPGGSTWFISSTSLSVESGVKGEGLMTTVQPTRSAGMTCQAAMISGQFQGVIDPTTPTGLRRTTIFCLASSWMVSSGSCSPAVTRVQAAAPCTSKLAPGPLWVLPCSRVTSSDSAAWCWSMRSATAMSLATRSASASPDQAARAPRALSTAASTSATEPCGQAATTEPSAGLRTSKVPEPGLGLPPMVSAYADMVVSAGRDQ